MKIKIIQIGKNKDQYIADASNEFLKMLKKFANVEIVVLKTKTIEEEGKEILKHLSEKSPDEFVIALDEKGNQYDSNGFSKIIEQKKNAGINIIFIIGGPFGLSSEVKKRANLILSFSKMTFTHQMIRVILLEQIYRAFTIIAGSEYHH